MARLFVSDLHLDASAPEANDQFLDFLRAHAAHAEALYILGDLFESWVGDDEEDAEKARICAGLRALTASGVACFALHGNRDFLLGRGFCDRTGVRLLPDPIVIELDGARVLITHGDALCTDDHSYQELRSAVRTIDWQQRFLRLPLAMRERFAAKARAGSRVHTARTVPQIMDVNQSAVAAALRATRTEKMIHGHTHRPGIHEVKLDERTAQRIVLGAWYEQGSYLSYERGRFELRELQRTH
jgi:UDP-2,3-diacylglucosamine hydrolase